MVNDGIHTDELNAVLGLGALLPCRRTLRRVEPPVMKFCFEWAKPSVCELSRRRPTPSLPSNFQVFPTFTMRADESCWRWRILRRQ